MTGIELLRSLKPVCKLNLLNMYHKQGIIKLLPFCAYPAVFEKQYSVVITNLNHEVVYANTSFLDMHGFALADIYGKDINRMLLRTEEDYNRMLFVKNEAIRTLEPQEIISKRKTKKTLTTVSLNLFPLIDKNRKPTHIVGMAKVEITEYFH